MSEPFLAEIKIVSFNFAPKGWALCNGQFLPIGQNQALFALLGTIYGGNGQTTFALPDLRSRVPIHTSADNLLGEQGGVENHTLLTTQVPAHTHALRGRNAIATSATPQNNVLARAANGYAPAANPTPMGSNMIGAAGGGQAHNNMQPFLVLNFVIALQGIFPSQS